MAEFDPVAAEEKFVSQLPPKERAIFMWLKRLLKLEKDTADQPVKARVKWDLGKSTEDILNSTLLLKDSSSLPLSKSGSYEAFEFTIGYIPTTKDYQLPRSEYQEKIKQYPPYKGSADIRIIDQGKVVKFFANMGSLEGMDEEWELLIGDLPYPIVVEDRSGYSFRNAAAQQK